MKPILLPLVEKMGRAALARRGVTSRHVHTPVGRLHVYDAAGTGPLPPVVLLHGLGSTATAFGPMLGRLRRDFSRVVVPDYPGHGSSELRGRLTPSLLFEAVDKVLATLDVGPAVLVGNSLGGAVALHFATEDPARVRALVLVSPAGAHVTDEEWEKLRTLFSVSSRAEGKAFLDRLYHTRPWFLSAIAHEMPAALSRRAVIDILHNASNDVLPGPEKIRSLDMPVLFLWGADERLLFESQLAYFKEHLPRHAVVEHPETYAHCPHFDHPADLARRVTAFVQSELSGKAAAGRRAPHAPSTPAHRA